MSRTSRTVTSARPHALSLRQMRADRSVVARDVVDVANERVCDAHRRPCPIVSCPYHLYLDVKPNGNLQLNFPDLEPWELKETCSLDIARRGGASLAVVGEALNLTQERARQLCLRGLRKLLAAFQQENSDAAFDVLALIDAINREHWSQLEESGDVYARTA